MTTVHLIISGEVQGVYYRATAKETAVALGVTGWVKNANNGNVEAMACGEDGAVEAFVEWCKKGPDNAQVEKVIVTEMPGVAFDYFDIKRD